MLKLTFAVMATALSVGLASPALADSQYYIPVCTGNDVPTNSACRMGGPQGTPTASTPLDRNGLFVGGLADELPAVSPGANPYIPVGVGN